MLFNSRTEGNTYAMIGPVYGALIAEAAFRLKNRRSTGWMIAAVVLSVANFELAVLITPRDRAVWICPLVCVVVTGYLVLQLIRELQSTSPNLDDANKQEQPRSQVRVRSEAA